MGLLQSPIWWASFLLLVALCLGCTRPSDWQEKTVSEVLRSSKLSIVGVITGYDVVYKPDEVIDVKYNIDIKCILTNTDKIDLPDTINITSVQFREIGNANSCEINYIRNIQYNRTAAITFRPYTVEPGEFLFSWENFQGPFFYEDMYTTCGATGASVSLGLMLPLVIIAFSFFLPKYLA